MEAKAKKLSFGNFKNVLKSKKQLTKAGRNVGN